MPSNNFSTLCIFLNTPTSCTHTLLQLLRWRQVRIRQADIFHHSIEREEELAVPCSQPQGLPENEGEVLDLLVPLRFHEVVELTV
jgi:hypothetical protein